MTTTRKKLSAAMAAILCLLLVLAMLPVHTQHAANEVEEYTNDKVTTTATINFRSGPGTRYSRIGSVPKGTTVDRIGTDGTWSYVRYNGREGWISSKYVKETGVGVGVGSGSGSISGAKLGTATATGRANVRSGPSTSYKSMGKVKKGTAYDYYEIASNGWVRINFNGKEGWVSGSYMRVGSAANSNSGSSSDNSGSTNTGTGYVQAKAGVNVRSGPGTKYGIIGGLWEGDVAIKLGTSGNWVKIQTGSGQTGYVSKSYVRDVSASAAASGNSSGFNVYIPGNSSTGGSSGFGNNGGFSGNSGNSGNNGGSLGSSSGTPAVSNGSLDTGMASEIVRLVNKERTSRGLPALSVSSNATAVAQVRAKEIVADFSHYSASGALSTNMGENISKGCKSAAAFMNAWMNSSGHRANILNENYGTIGVGVYQYGGRLYAVQIFERDTASEFYNSLEGDGWVMQDPWGSFGNADDLLLQD